ncbi:hypothetical protein HCJ67_13665 [Listeria marthii]|nr:hypothetical protein [Listeria marthii]MBC1999360.1 hypothetical protein [Listeria marthii]
MEDDSLCGGRSLQEGLHDRFARMHIWAVIRFASNGRMGVWVFGRWWMDCDGGVLFVWWAQFTGRIT